MEETKRCPYCDELIRANAIKCKHCNSMLTDFSQPTNVDYGSYIKIALSAKYEIINEIGRGGMASVYRTVQKNLGKTVALKVIHPNHVHDKELLDRFHREARISAQLNHPNIITIFDEGIENGIHFMSMELLEGIDLHNRIKEKGPLGTDELSSIIIPISNALNYAHSCGLIHRDIKSANIFITTTGRPVLMDFGIAHASKGTQLTMSGSIIGTPEFMSPEQADGKDIDGRSDIYSLGVVMYQSLTGQLPYRSDNPLVTINKIISESYIAIDSINPKISGWMIGIVDGCLVKDKTKRIQNCKELTTLLKERKEISPNESLSLFKTQNNHHTIKINKERKALVSEKLKGDGLSKEVENDVTQIKKNNTLKSLRIIIAMILVTTLILIFVLVSYKQSKELKSEAPILEQTDEDNTGNLDNKFVAKNAKKDTVPDEYKTIVSDEHEKKSAPVEEKLIEVPTVIGLTERTAKQVLAGLGLKIVPLITMSTPENSGRVFEQTPKEIKVKKGSPITIKIGI